MPDAMRDVPPTASAPAAAKRGRRDERLLAKLRLAALVAREHGVTVRVHGIEICNKRKPSLLQKEMQHQVLTQDHDNGRHQAPRGAFGRGQHRVLGSSKIQCYYNRQNGKKRKPKVYRKPR
jgi:hypothetical protein